MISSNMARKIYGIPSCRMQPSSSAQPSVKDMPAFYYITKSEGVPCGSAAVKKDIDAVCKQYAFRANSYYISLINWDDPADPIRQIIIPDTRELEEWGRLDASKESLYKKAPGLEHKYRDTAVLLVTDVCGGFCRFCFRKRLFMDGNAEVTRDYGPGIDYIRNHPEINNVLLTGGDPLMLSTTRLSDVITRLREIDHVNIIRIGSKLPGFNPFRIIEDPGLIALLRKFSTPRKRIYVMTHFNHPRELTKSALKAVDMLIHAGVIVANQTPLLRGVNDDPRVLSDLIQKLSYAGIPPYYIFQGRPTAGNHHFTIPVEQSIAIFEEARSTCAGLAKRARLVMSHETGKIEILGKKENNVFFRYFRSVDLSLLGKILVYKSNPAAYWFDDYQKQ